MTDVGANPYVGPRTFQEKDKGVFFGREREASELLSLVISEPLVLFYAQSGAGKSSLLNTRLIPDLRAEDFRVLPVGRVSGGLPEGIRNVANIFVFNLLLSLDESEGKAEHLTQTTLTEYLQTHESKLAIINEDIDFEEPARVLIIDQFEEIVTTHLDHWPERRDFFRQLKQAMANDPLLWVVLTMREDYIAALDPYARLLPNNLRIHYRMPRMGYEAALEAIERPAKQAGRPFAPGVAQKLVDNLRQIRTYEQEQVQLGQFVEPVQLQVVCYQLWENLKDQPPGEITQADVQRLGNVDTALAQFYEQAIAATLEKTGGSEISLRDWFQHKLITEAGTRGTVYRGPKKTGGLANQTVDLLEAQFLLRAEIRAGGTWYELVHDRFVEPILQSNQAWREKLWRQSPLIQAAQAWEDSGRDPAKLYRGQQLENALIGLEFENQEPLVQEFLAASEEMKRARELAEANRRAKRLGWTITGLGILLLLAVVAAIFALYQRGLAQTNADRADEARATAEAERINAVDAKILAETKGAEAERRRLEAEESRAEAEVSRAEADNLREQVEQQARSRQLATQAMEVLNKQPNLTLLLSVAANEITRTIESEDSLLEALQRSPNLKTSLAGHTDRVWSAVFSPDGQILATGGDDGRILLWDVTSKQLLVELPADPTADVYSLAFSPNGAILASGNNHSTITLWNVKSRQKLGQPFMGHTGGIFTVAFSPDGQSLASGSADGTIILWDVASSRPLGLARGRLTGHSDWVWQVAFSPNGQSLASASRDHTVRLWDVAAQQPIGQPLIGHRNTVASVAFSPDGQTIASGDGFGVIFLWDVATQLPLAEPLTEHPNTVWGLVFSPDSQRLISSSGEGKIIVWDLKNRQPVDQDGDLQPDFDLAGHEDWVYRLALSPDGQTLASPGGDHAVILWDLSARSRLATLLTQHATDIWNVAYSPAGGIVAFGARDGLVGFWEVEKNQLLGPLQHQHKEGVNWVTFNPNGNILASASHDDSIILWDVASQQPLGLPLTGHKNNVSSVAFSPDGQTLASSSADGAIILWDVATQAPLGEPLRKDEHSVNSVAFSPDGQKLAAGGDDSDVTIWDLATRQPVRSFGPHGERVSAVAFSPDGKMVAAGTLGSLVRLWDLSSGDSIWDFTGHSRPVYSVAFSPDGQTLATASADNSIMLWDVATRRRLGQPLTGHDQRVWSVAFSPDGQFLASGGADGKILQWELNFESWLNGACRLANRNLSVVEWELYFKDDPYRKICPNAPLHPSLIEKGQELVAAGDVDGAIRDMLGFIEADAKAGLESEVRQLVARQLIQTGWNSIKDGQTEQAISQFRQALELDPTLDFAPETKAQEATVQTLLSEALYFAREEELDKAITSFEQALKLAPNLNIQPETRAKSIIALNRMEAGRNLANQGDSDAAIRQFETALELDPTLANQAALALIKQGQALANTHDIEAALALFAKSQELAPDLEMSTTVSDILCRAGATVEMAAPVTDACDEAVRLALNQAQARHGRGQVRAILGDVAGAIEDFSFVVERLNRNELYQPKSAPVEQWLAKLEAGLNPFVAKTLSAVGRELAQAGEIEQALAQLEEARRLDPELGLDPEQEVSTFQAERLLEEGRELARAGNVRDARAIFEEALALNPELEFEPAAEARRLAAESQIEQGRRLIEEGNIEQAITHFEKAQIMNPNTELNISEELKAQGNNLAQQGQIETALKLYQKARQLDPRFEISAGMWNSLCRSGSLPASAAEVMNACAQAVALAPDAAWAHYGRGLARALTGDRAGAIQDFGFIVELLRKNEFYQAGSSPVEAWLIDLQAGKRLDQESLEQLRNE